MTIHTNFASISDTRRKLYQREHLFNGFKDISEERYAELIAIRDRIKRACEERTENRSSNIQLATTGLNQYLAFLQYVTNPQIHRDLPTFDERILLLILGSDPELHAFYKYLTAPVVEQITQKNGVKEIHKYIDEDAYSQEVRDEIGFYDPKLRLFEEAYFKKYVSKNQLVKESKRSKMNQLIDRANKVESFDKISDVRFEELSAMAEQYHIELGDVDYKTISYHVGVQYDYFRLRTVTEQELMLILLVDPNMEMLKIYEEESQVNRLAKRCIEAFGFYSQSFINLEKKYKKRFYPDLKLNTWSL